MQHWDGAAILRACLDHGRNRALRAAILARLNIRTHDRTILSRWCPTITEPAAKKTTGRIRKESFKPRPNGDGVGRGGGGWETGFRGVVEEDEC